MEHPMAQKLISFVKSGDCVILKISPVFFSTWEYGESS